MDPATIQPVLEAMRQLQIAQKGAGQAERTRQDLAREVCRALRLRRPDGTWAVRSACGLLIRLETVRNVATSLLRLAGAENIAASTRYLGRRIERPLRLLGLA